MNTVVDDRGELARAEELAALLEALAALRAGDASVRLPRHWSGLAGKVADVFNDVVEQNATMASELARLRQVVGKEGKLKQRAAMRDPRGFWGESVGCINALIDDLVHPTWEVARVIGAVAQGDLSKSMALEVGTVQVPTGSDGPRAPRSADVAPRALRGAPQPVDVEAFALGDLDHGLQGRTLDDGRA